MNRLMRRPSPDFTTACATRNAVTTSSTLALANPAKAFTGDTVPVRTAAAAASRVEVSSGNDPASTDEIAATNTANRCQAGAVRPAGIGVSQRLRPSTNGKACLMITKGRLMGADLLCPEE